MSNVVEFEARALIERQAREWLTRLDGDEPLSTQEIGSLREWMARGFAHRQELTRISNFWNQANILTELAIPLIRPERNLGARARPFPRGALAASALLGMASLGWWSLQRIQAPMTRTYATGVGEQTTIVLPDGSSVELNTNTRLQVTYTRQRRRIHLWRGEALFSAAHDPNRAFEVYANGSVVRALGTAFAVHLEGSKVDVTVTSGVVDVAETTENNTSGSDQETPRVEASTRLGVLTAGQATTVSSNRRLRVEQLAEPELQRRIAWHDGYLVFSGQPLSQVVEQINRYSPITLAIGDPTIASVVIGGRFRIGDLEAILEVLHTNFGIQARQLDNHNIRLESERHR